MVEAGAKGVMVGVSGWATETAPSKEPLDLWRVSAGAGASAKSGEADLMVVTLLRLDLARL